MSKRANKQNRKRQALKGGPVQVRTPDTMVTAIEKAMRLIDDDTAADLVEGMEDVGTLAAGMADVFRLMYRVLVSNRKLKDIESNRETFAKGQLMAASILQTAVAVGIREGQLRSLGLDEADGETESDDGTDTD